MRSSVASQAGRRAFTLIEMLVVISLIVLLISMILPALGSAKIHAKTTICGTNLSQLGRAMDGYITDTGFYPGAHTWTSNGHPATWIVWPARLRDYTNGETEIFWCPLSNPAAQWKVVEDGKWDAGFGYAKGEQRLNPSTPFSYGYNNWGTADFAVPQRGLGGLVEHSDWGELRETKVKSPSNMYAIADSTITFVWDAFIDHNQWPERPADRHFGNAQTLFADTHVEMVPRIEMIFDAEVGNVMTDDQLRRWNNDNRP